MALNGGGNIAAHLTRRATESPHQHAVIFPAGRTRDGRVTYTHLTYAQLDAESDALARGLVADGLAPGTRVAVMVPPSLPFFAVTFALFKAGLVPVFIDPGMGLKALKRCLAEAAPAAFVGSPKAHLARHLFGWCRGRLERVIGVGAGSVLLGAAELARFKQAAGDLPARAAEDVAAVLFTSGSTGAPKGAVYRHGTFGAQIDALRGLFGIAPGEIDLCTFPLFALFAPALGMTAVVPDMDFTRPAAVNAAKLFEAVEDFGVTNLFGSPALLRAVARAGAASGVRLPSLRRVISAGAPVSPRIVRAVTPLLAPGVEVHTPYGATEALPVACLGSHEIINETAWLSAEGKGICVGRPAPGVAVEIVRITDGAVPAWSDAWRVEPGAIGEIVVRGPQVTEAYFSRPEADALAKVRAADGAVLHRMGDVGYFDEQGRLWFCGRKAHRVTTARGELYTDPCEGVFNAHERVHRTALVGRGPRGAETPVLCVEADGPLTAAEKTRLRADLLALGAARPATAAIREVRFFKALPVDTRHNAKIFREQLKRRVERGRA